MMPGSIAAIIVLILANRLKFCFSEGDQLSGNSTERIIEIMDKLENNLDNLAKYASKLSLPYMMKMSEEVNISSSCLRSGIRFLTDIRQLRGWTFQLIDSLGKASGIFSGKTWLNGDYDQCLNIEVKDNKIRKSNRKINVIYGKFCALNIGFRTYNYENLPEDVRNTKIFRLIDDVFKPFTVNQVFEAFKYRKASFRLDICIPSTCSRNDLDNVLQWVFEDPYSAKVKYCKVRNEKIIPSTAQIICLTALSIFVAWVIIGTIVETALEFNANNASCNKSKLIQNLVSVSMYESTRKLFSTSFNEKTKFFCGIKFFLICVVVFVHILIFSGLVYTTTEKLFNIVNLADDAPVEISSQGMSLIETFFFLSGFLTQYLRKSEGDKRLTNYIIFFVKRYIRLTFPILCVLAMVIILPLTGEGPHWDMVYRVAEMAEHYWWRYVLHIQNLYNLPIDFLTPLWFINALMQLTLLTVPLLCIQDRWPKFGSITLCILIVAGIISHVYQLIITKYFTILGVSINLEKLENLAIHIYQRPYFTHLSSYCLGLLIGCILSQKNQIKFSKIIVVSCWIATVSLIGLVFFGLHSYRTSSSPNELVILAHQILSPIAWMAVTAWMCVACITGYGGIASRFLSHNFFLILDRLTVWIYIVHSLFILYLFGEFRNPQSFTEINLWMMFLLVMLLSIIASAMCYIFLQTPFTYFLSKLFLSGNPEKNISYDEHTKMETLRGKV